MKNRFKRLSSLLLAMTFVLGISLTPVMAEERDEKEIKIDILHVNDTHARIDTTDTNLGYAGISSYYEMVKKENPHTFLVDAGDALHGDNFAHIANGASIVKLMNEVGYDAMVPGNHDFNYGADRVAELEKIMNFPILAANVEGSNFKPYTMVEKEGVSVAFIGVTTPESAYKTHPDNVKNMKFTNVVQAVEKAVKEIETNEKVDLVVVLAHLGIDGSTKPEERSTALKNVEGIDLIIDGHSHSELVNGMVINEETGLLIASAGEYDKNMGHVTITIVDGKKDIKAALVPAAEALEKAPANEKITKEIESIKEAQAEILDEVIGHSNVVLVGEREIVRTGESNLSNLVTEAVKDETGADIVIYNGGNIRATLEPGDITKGDILTVLPFNNYSVSKEMPGSAIVEVLEHGVSAYPETSGGFPQVAGIRFSFDASKPVGARITYVEVDGVELDLEKIYTVVTNDFLAAGGDGFETYTNYAIKNEFGSPEDAVMVYLASGKEIPEADGRIKEVSGIKETVTPEGEKPAEVKPEETKPEEAKEEVAATTYVVEKNDSLWKIAKIHLGDGARWPEIHKANPQIKNPNLIYIGDIINIPAA